MTADEKLQIFSYPRDLLLAERDRIEYELNPIPESEAASEHHKWLIERQRSLEAVLAIQDAVAGPNRVIEAILYTGTAT